MASGRLASLRSSCAIGLSWLLGGCRAVGWMPGSDLNRDDSPRCARLACWIWMASGRLASRSLVSRVGFGWRRDVSPRVRSSCAFVLSWLSVKCRAVGWMPGRWLDAGSNLSRDDSPRVRSSCAIGADVGGSLPAVGECRWGVRGGSGQSSGRRRVVPCGWDRSRLFSGSCGS